MKMTVGELRDKLDDYGDHLEVAVVVTNEDSDFGFERILRNIQVEDTISMGEPLVTIGVDLGSD